MKRLRTLSTRRLIGLAVAFVVLLAGVGIAQASLASHPTPPPKALDVAVHDALTAPPVAGITARVTFTNHLIPSGALPEGTASPLMAGASGRLWVRGDGRFRVELQSSAGDAQVVSDGKLVTVYDASANTVYRFQLPQASAAEQAKPDAHTPPTLARIQQAIADLGRSWTLSGAEPTSTAHEPTYTVRIAPKGDGGLLGAAQLAWDATNGVPLRAAVYAAGQADPVLELRATHVSFGAVSERDVAATPPADAKVVDLSPSTGDAGATQPSQAGHADAKPVKGVAAVQAQLPFKLAAPDQLAGLPRRDVWLAGHGERSAAVALYGKGLGAIVVAEHKLKAGEQPALGGGGSRHHDLQLPQININGATGHELATALGTVVVFERGGVETIVAGSVPPQAAETAARQLG